MFRVIFLSQVCVQFHFAPTILVNIFTVEIFFIQNIEFTEKKSAGL